MTAAPPIASCLYFGRVMHKRLRPFVHRFAYRVFSFYLDLDELASLDRRLPLFSYNRWNVFSFFERDHGAHDGSPLRPWIEQKLAAAGIDIAKGPVRILCFPRVLGYVFNPLSVWFCFHGDGTLRAVLYEVSNRRRQWHSYLIAVRSGNDVRGPILQECDKRFYVSPFIAMDATYRFRLQVPDERLAILIRESVAEGELLIATHTGRRAPLTGLQLCRALIAYPLMTLKVMGAIHWQALRLWLKGAKVYRCPAAPTPPMTVSPALGEPVTPLHDYEESECNPARMS